MKKVRIPYYSAYQWVLRGIDWVFPPMCAGCGVRGSRWCRECSRKTKKVGHRICNTCGRRVDRSGDCYRCLQYPPDFISVRSWAIYNGPIRNAIHRLKYNGDITLGDVLSRPMINLLNEQQWSFDLITPVPISDERSRERGYNQAALLAYPIAMQLEIPYFAAALKKERDIPTQVGLTIAERFANVSKVFAANGDIVRGKSILIIDDIMTSGATMSSCTDALLEKGAIEVYGLTLARAG